jgi:hypothetical protein
VTSPAFAPLPRLDLGYGWSAGLIPGIKAAWGARAIINQDGMVDFLADRTGAAGDPALVSKTIDWLNSVPSDGRALHVLGQALDAARRGLEEGRIHTREARGIVLYQDRTGAVIGNTSASAGYLYLAAYLFEALPENSPTKGLEIAMGLVGEDQAAEI